MKTRRPGLKFTGVPIAVIRGVHEEDPLIWPDQPRGE